MKRIGKRPDFDLAREFPIKKPFLFIDAVREFVEGKCLIAEKSVTGDESFFRGHFPGQPVMPGHLIAEALVQCCGLYRGLTVRGTDEDRVFLLTSSKVSFFKPVLPPATLIMTCEPVKIVSFGGVFSARARVKRTLVAQGQFTLAFGRQKRNK